ncbi:N-acetylmuramoyl-L-alanine amidase [Desulfogranum japonicum]|uniref:N-acetylmuramoyl-L-alanine amidase n=1 Tax=Desulfogranum japonicum TaxID=231447 RepID=UPI000422090B|nr:N-acetylmuramoyl-L-alanine amidase [Desulfogranum japonicum]
MAPRVFSGNNITLFIRSISISVTGALLYLLTLGVLCLLYPQHSRAIELQGTSSTKSAYQTAKDNYYRLERDNQFGQQRNNWLSGVRQFRKIYLQQAKGPYAPSALYMMGRMQKKMFDQFHYPIDLEHALEYFHDVSSIFPSNKLADDALYNQATIYLNDKQNPQLAAEHFLKIIDTYPQGDKYAQALNELQKLKKTTHITIPENIRSSQNDGRLIQVLPVQYWSSQDYTRVVIRASGPVHFSSDLLEKNTDNPRRLYIDFHQSHIPPKYRLPVPIEDGLLRQVRSGQYNETTVRVVLDIESISDYKIFSLNDPFRVVVDVHGKKFRDTIKKQEKKDQSDLHVVQENTKKPVLKKAGSGHPFITLQEQKKRIPKQKSVHSENRHNEISLAQQLGLGVRRIVIDPGHGGRDPGASAFGLREKDIVLSVAKKLADILTSSYGYETVLTRNADTFIPLEERTAIANTQNADLFISIHVNAHPDKKVSGVETYYLNLATNAEAMRVAALENATSTHNISEMQDILTDLMKNSKINESSRLAQYVHANLASSLESSFNVRNLGVKQAPFYVLIGAEMPAILSEVSFITNPKEARLLRSKEYQTTIAKQIAVGVISYIDHHTSAALIQ